MGSLFTIDVFDTEHNGVYARLRSPEFVVYARSCSPFDLNQSESAARNVMRVYFAIDGQEQGTLSAWKSTREEALLAVTGGTADYAWSRNSVRLRVPFTVDDMDYEFQVDYKPSMKDRPSVIEFLAVDVAAESRRLQTKDSVQNAIAKVTTDPELHSRFAAEVTRTYRKSNR